MKPLNLSRVGVLDFVRRQTETSPYDHFAGSWDELIQLTETHWNTGHVSPNNSGVYLVPMPQNECHRFYSSIIPVTTETPLHAYFRPRTEGEDAIIQIEAFNKNNASKKTVAISAEIILYSQATLAQDNDAPTPQSAEYYIVSVNAYPTNETTPMRPITMARNFLNLTGGTQPETPYNADDFAKSIIYWSQHTRLAP